MKGMMTVGNLNDYARLCHLANEKWWRDPETGEMLPFNKGEKIALIHSELSEMLEGERKDAMDDHLPHRRSAEVEAADALIRLFDYCGRCGYDVDGAFREKMQYNETREDHTPEARRAAGGKKF